MKYLDAGYAYKRHNLHPEEATTSEQPYALVGPDGNVLLIEHPNQSKHPAIYRTKESAQQALDYAKPHIPAAAIWDRRSH